jgi:hypothetical protein
MNMQRDRGSTAVSGWYPFAGTIFILLGGINILQGLIAIFKDDYFAVTKGGLLFLDFTYWGVFWVIVGVIDVFVGFGILNLRTWARVVGIVLLMLNVIVQFAFIAAFPIWTVAAIALNITVIFALMKPLEPYEQSRRIIE